MAQPRVDLAGLLGYFDRVSLARLALAVLRQGNHLLIDRHNHLLCLVTMQLPQGTLLKQLPLAFNARSLGEHADVSAFGLAVELSRGNTASGLLELLTGFELCHG